MIRRHLLDALEAALADTPAVFLAGPRQAGKSTLAQSLCRGRAGRRYLTFDDATVMAAARRDPAGFLSGLEGDVVLDEVQRVPELFLALKSAIDRDRRAGRFLLTGSAAILVVPQVAEALAGRAEILNLWPLSQGEIEDNREGFIDASFSDRFPGDVGNAASRRALCRAIVRGGFPEVRKRAAAERRDAWFRSYVSTLLNRDVRDLAAIEGLSALPHLLHLLAERTGGLLNYADVSRSTTLPQSTVKRYMTLLEGMFLIRRIPPWSGSRTVRLVKAPKVYPVDSGLASHLVDVDVETLIERPERLGPLLEAFVVAEIVKQLGWSRSRPAIHHFRTHGGREVDLVLEDRRGRCVAIETKAAASIGPGDLKGIEAFASAAGRRFRRGILLHTGREMVPFGSNIHALPVSTLWRSTVSG
jgi:predicted AAA+ superfamily ATPase